MATSEATEPQSSPSPDEAPAPQQTAVSEETPASEQPVSESAPVSHQSPSVAPALFVAVACAALFCLAVVRFGWASDDSFITGRTLDSFWQGLGLVINAGERVQSYTSPLWMLICLPLYGISNSPYLSVVLPGLLLSFGLAIGVIRYLRDRPWAAAVLLLTLTASITFLGYCTAGLENSLAHLLVLLLFFSPWRGTKDESKAGLRALLAASAFLFLTRFDYALVLFPGLAAATWWDRRNLFRNSWVFLLPTVAWFLFALFYYGFPFPNTAYAKLNTVISMRDRLAQGLSYVVDSVYRDPVLMFGALAPLLAIPWSGLSTRNRLLLTGSALYIAYVIWIGGDFMGGRFFSVPFLLGLLVAVDALRGLPESAWQKVMLAAGLLAASHLVDRRTNRTHTECVVPPSGIVDERECYVEHTGLSQNVRIEKWKTHGYLDEYRRALPSQRNGILFYDQVGLATFATKDRVHIVERFALSEPLLARIRWRPVGFWRPGHLAREMPRGYYETLISGKNQIADPCLHDLYDDLYLAVRAPLFSSGRFGAIARLNTTRRTCPAPI